MSHDEYAESIPQGGIRRDVPTPGPARAAFVKEWQDKVVRAKRHWKSSHDRMRDDMDFYMGKQWSKTEDDERYVANIVQAHVRQRVAALYAKNPKVVAKRRQTLDFAIWDENMSAFQQIQAGFQASMQTGMPPDPILMQTMQDIKQGFDRRTLMDKLAKTMEIVFKHELEEQQPPFKSQMKQAVRRACVTGLSYLKLGFHRVMEKRPEDVEKITDITEQLATLDRLLQDQHAPGYDENCAKAEQLRLLMQEIAEREEMIVKEGLVFDFPTSTSIIPDPKCRQLKGFVGADWVAQEFVLSLDEIKEIYQVDLGDKFSSVEQEKQVVGAEKDPARATVWEIYSKKDGLVYTVADGFHEFLCEPDEPVLKLERFWPFFTLIFNEVESEKDIFPPSDVRLMRPIQLEYNRVRQGLREHRHANRPAYATYMGALSEVDVNNLKAHPANAVIQLQNLQPGQSVDGVLQPIKHAPIDPALYDTSMLLEDTQRVVGSQEANLGSTGDSTATEVSVAESGRLSGLSSNIDDLDDFLSEVAKAAGQVLLMQMDEVTVKKIAGPGAIWPQLTVNEVVSELMLEIEAGSSGRPNKAIEIQNFERIAPTLLQIPGISPEWLAREALKRLDDGLDPTDAIKAAIPSIVAQNAMTKGAGMGLAPSTGNPMTDPNAQGDQGAMNDPAAPAAPAGPVPNVPQLTPSAIRSGATMPPPG